MNPSWKTIPLVGGGQMNWRKLAGMFPAPTFPIAIAWDGRKWQKRPLTRNGHLDAQLGGCDGPWDRANGFGIVMGGGLIALDVDSYKKAAEANNWIAKWRVPKKTRTHTTVSGGAHLPNHRHRLSEAIPDVDTSSLEGIIATAQIVAQMTAEGRLGQEEASRFLTVLTNTAQLMGFLQIGELREMIKGFEQQGVQGRGVGTVDLPKWGGFLERAKSS